MKIYYAYEILSKANMWLFMKYFRWDSWVTNHAIIKHVDMVLYIVAGIAERNDWSAF